MIIRLLPRRGELMCRDLKPRALPWAESRLPRWGAIATEVIVGDRASEPDKGYRVEKDCPKKGADDVSYARRSRAP